MLRLKNIVAVMRMREACGVPPEGDGACFGALDPSRLRSPMPVAETSLQDEGGRSAEACLEYEKDEVTGDVRIVQVDSDPDCFRRVIDPETGHIQYLRPSEKSE